MEAPLWQRFAQHDLARGDRPVGEDAVAKQPAERVEAGLVEVEPVQVGVELTEGLLRLVVVPAGVAGQPIEGLADRLPATLRHVEALGLRETEPVMALRGRFMQPQEFHAEWPEDDRRRVQRMVRKPRRVAAIREAPVEP